MKEEYKEYYKIYLDEYGISAESRLCIEEMSELIKEICKLERYRGTENESAIVESLKEEIADVLNTIEQLYLFYGPDDIDNIREAKLLRGIERIKNTRK